MSISKRWVFVCDVCGKEGISFTTPNQKRHSGECARTHERLKAAKRKGTGKSTRGRGRGRNKR